MQQEYKKIWERLEGDVGWIIKIITKHNGSTNETHPISPFWALTRMLFPICESLGDLYFRGKNKNALPEVMKVLLSSQNQKYAELSHIIVQLYRHSLIHTDEMRSLITEYGTINWEMTISGKPHHLHTYKQQDGSIRINFDLTQFYDDLVYLSSFLYRTDISKDVTAVYEGWRVLDLKHKEHLTPSETEAINEAKLLLSDAKQ